MTYKENYDALKTQYSDSSSLMYKKLRIVDSYINEGNNILDIGIGVGELIDLEKTKFKYLNGFDVDPESVDFCNKRFRIYDHIKIQLGDLYDLEKLIKGIKFDCVTCLDVLEHVNEDICLKTMKSIYKFLNEDGMFIFTGPGMFEKVMIKLGRSPHIHSHSSYGWERMLKKSNFKIVSVESVEFPLFNKNQFMRKNFHIFGKCCLIVCKK